MIQRENIAFDQLRITNDLSSEADITIFYYPYYMDSNFDTKESESLIALSKGNIKVDVIEGKSRPLSDFPEIVDIAISFISLRVLESFIKSIGSNLGSDIYKGIKKWLIDRFTDVKDHKGIEIKRGVHLEFTLLIQEQLCQVKLAIRLNELNENYDLDEFIVFINSIVFENPMKSILVKSISNAPHWEFVYGVDKDNQVVYL